MPARNRSEAARPGQASLPVTSKTGGSSRYSIPRRHQIHAIRRGCVRRSQNLMVWDVVIGTRYLPKHALPTEHIGIEDPPRFPAGRWSKLLVPFRWARVQREAGPA